MGMNSQPAPWPTVLRHRRTVGQGAVRPTLVILSSPSFDQHLSFPQGFKHLPVQQLIPQLPVEALHISVFPRTAWFDVQCLDSYRLEPVLTGPRFCTK